MQTYAVLPKDLFLTVESFPTLEPAVLLIETGSITDLAGLSTELVPVTVEDKLAPVLQISFDRAATNGLIGIRVTSDEQLASTPSITVNGLTRGVPTKIDEREWELVFDIATLTGLDVGQGPKTVGAFGFDKSNVLGEAAQVTFELDTTFIGPTLTPSGSSFITEAFPVITASYAAEAGEYAGDSHNGVSLILATLDGQPVGPIMSTPDGGRTWTLKAVDVYPDGYDNGVHVFEVQAVDAAGNTHEVARTVFVVDVPAPEPVIEPAIDEVGDGDIADPPEETVPDEDQSSEATDPADETGPDAGQTTEGDSDVVTEPAATTDDLSAPVEEPQAPTVESEDLDNPEVGDELTADAEGEEQTVALVETDVVPDPVEDIVAVADVDAGAVDDGVEPNVDPVFDREAEFAALDGESDGAATSTEETGGAIFGCNLPLGNSNVVGGEYALLGLGILGLALRRPAGALRGLWSSADATNDPQSQV